MTGKPRQGILKNNNLSVAQTHTRRVSRMSTGSTYRYSNSHSRPDYVPRNSSLATTPITATGLGGLSTNKRMSLSPSPLTPRSSSYRRNSGLRGRKSTSSSVSSIRSIHNNHQHSKASSTTSSLASPTGSFSFNKIGGRSPHASVKVLPATPTNTTFPSSVRLVRTPLSIDTNHAQTFAGIPLASPGIMFAKRKRSPFKGPMLSVHTGSSTKSRGESISRSSSQRQRKSGELIIEEEDEDEEEEGVEVVEEFSPVKPGETVICES